MCAPALCVVRHWGRSLGKSLTIRALTKALKHYLAPDYRHFDREIQYARVDYIAMLTEAGTHISMSAMEQCTQNELVERYIRTLKEEHVDFSDYYGYDEALSKAGH